MEHIAEESSSIRAIAKMFENISVPMLFTNVHSKLKEENSNVEINENFNSKSTTLGNESNTSKSVNSVVSNEKMRLSDNNQDDEENMKPVIDDNVESQTKRETNVYKHLKTYPIVNSWIKIFNWFPLPKVLRPRLLDIAYSNNLNNYTTSIDNYLDSQLNSLDQFAPFVKTLRMRDIRNTILDDPIKNFTKQTTKSINNVITLTQTFVIQPSRNSVQDLRDLRGQYISFMGNQPIIRSQLDQNFEYFNKRLIKNINTYLPSTTKDNDDHDMNNVEIPINFVSLDNERKEIIYTGHLINLAILRSRPILEDRFKKLFDLPTETRKYVAVVYNESKENRGDSKIVIVIATLETIRKIVTESFEFISIEKFHEFLSTQPTVEENLSLAEEIKSDDENKETKK